MKPKPPEKKLTLKLQVDERVDFRIIGISSHENDYRMVWSVNQELGMQFTRVENLVVHQPKLKTDLSFSKYRFDDEDRYIRYNLIANRCPDGILFPEIKNIDFVLQVAGEMNETGFQALVKKLKGISVVSAVFVLHPEKIKGIARALQE
ncbi:MAG: IPExxxVDY family protein [Bacteroidales bacterium]|nr:IPExxxVDY family protein [Bacteroidales bacterium]